MKYLKSYEKYSGKFMSERKPGEKIDFEKLLNNIEIGDWLEFYSGYWNYDSIKKNKTEAYKEIGYVLEKGDPNVDYNVKVSI